MSKLCIVLLAVTLLGCSITREKPEVVGVSDDVWQKVKKEIESRPKPQPVDKKKLEEDMEKLNKAMNEAAGPPDKR